MTSGLRWSELQPPIELPRPRAQTHRRHPWIGAVWGQSSLRSGPEGALAGMVTARDVDAPAMKAVIAEPVDVTSTRSR
jgi:hypothetical protein